MPSRPTATGNLWLARVLWDIGAVQFGDFNIGHTRHSPVYVNLRLLVSNPPALRRVARVIKEETQAYLSMMKPHIAPFSRVAGVPFGGLHLATAFSLLTGVPLIYLHPTHDGQGHVIEGSYVAGQTVVIIDDLITGGTSVVETAQHLREAGLQVHDAIVLLDRNQGGRERLRKYGIHLVPLLQLETLLNYLMSSGKIEEQWYRRSIEYLRDGSRPGAEG